MPKKLKLLIVLLIALFSINVYAEEEVQETTTEETPVLISPAPEEATTKEEVVEEPKEKKYEYINKETNFGAFVFDSANLLTEEEKDKLFEEMKPLTEFGHIAFETITENESTTELYAEEFYHNKFGQNSGSLFLIDMKNRVIYIFSDGFNYKYIDRTKAWVITDNVYTLARDQKYYECASKGISQIYDILTGTRILEPMRYASNIVLSILLAFTFSFIYVLSKSNIKKAPNKQIIDGCNVKFEVSDIEVKQTGTEREYSPVHTTDSYGGGSSSSHSSFGGGGGFSGGGGHSGGGGGHRF